MYTCLDERPTVLLYGSPTVQLHNCTLSRIQSSMTRSSAVGDNNEFNLQFVIFIRDPCFPLKEAKSMSILHSITRNTIFETELRIGYHLFGRPIKIRAEGRLNHVPLLYQMRNPFDTFSVSSIPTEPPGHNIGHDILFSSNVFRQLNLDTVGRVPIVAPWKQCAFREPVAVLPG